MKQYNNIRLPEGWTFYVEDNGFISIINEQGHTVVTECTKEDALEILRNIK